jgi:chloride channel 3/4/5
VHFHAIQGRARDYASSTISSLYDTPNESDPFDFTVYMDQAPLTVTSHSPLELVQQFFVKLGARYVVVVNPDGYCESPCLALGRTSINWTGSIDQGVIEKKGWLEFLGELEHKG